jgi:hypothetical protein
MGWLESHLKGTLYRWEAMQYFQIMVDHGYLIPLNIENWKASEESEILFTFQVRMLA